MRPIKICIGMKFTCTMKSALCTYSGVQLRPHCRKSKERLDNKGITFLDSSLAFLYLFYQPAQSLTSFYNRYRKFLAGIEKFHTQYNIWYQRCNLLCLHPFFYRYFYKPLENQSTRIRTTKRIIAPLTEGEREWDVIDG